METSCFVGLGGLWGLDFTQCFIGVASKFQLLFPSVMVMVESIKSQKVCGMSFMILIGTYVCIYMCILAAWLTLSLLQIHGCQILETVYKHSCVGLPPVRTALEK